MFNSTCLAKVRISQELRPPSSKSRKPTVPDAGPVGVLHPAAGHGVGVVLAPWRPESLPRARVSEDLRPMPARRRRRSWAEPLAVFLNRGVRGGSFLTLHVASKASPWSISPWRWNSYHESGVGGTQEQHGTMHVQQAASARRRHDGGNGAPPAEKTIVLLI